LNLLVKKWLSVITELKNRVVKEYLLPVSMA
jgi:hypothetical protein